MLAGAAIPKQRFNPAGRISRRFSVILPELFLVGAFCLCPAWADIYTYTDNDGRIYFTDTPTDKRYQVLISSMPSPEDAPLTETKKLSPVTSKGMDRKPEYDQIVENVARTYGLDSALLHAVISVESRYNPKAVSKKGASGLMQLMPNIARHYGVVDLLDPAQNLQGGAKYLRDMLDLFDNDVSLALAAYNAGETAVVRHGNRIPPFRETMNYVPKVMNYYREYSADRPRPSDNLAANGIALPLIPGRALLSNLGNSYVNAFSPQKIAN